MDSTVLILDKLKTLGEELNKTRDQYNRVSTDSQQTKSDLEARCASIERSIEAFDKIMAQIQRTSIPGLEVGGAKGKASWGRIAQICAQPGLLKDKGYGVEADVYRLMSSRIDSFDAQTRASINAATGEAGGFLIPTEMMNDLIPQLREVSIARQLGVTEINGLVGEVTWAKSKGGITAEHVNSEEEVAGNDSVATFDKIMLKPHPIAAFVPLTFEMRTQSAIALDDWVRSEVATQIGLLEDKTIFTGTGTSAAPRGVLNHPSIQSLDWTTAISGVTGSVVNTSVEMYDALLHCMKLTRKKFGHTLGNLGWATSPDVLYWLARARDAQNRAMFFSLVEGNMQGNNVPQRLFRYPILDSEQLDTGSDAAEILIYGPWADVILGHWGTMVFALSDQTETNFRKLRTTVRGVWQYDVGIFHADAFVKNTVKTDQVVA